MKSVFAEHDNPTFCCKQDVHAGIAPLLTLVADVQKQVIEYRAQLDAAVLADDSQEGQVEHFHQTLGAMEREAAAFATAGRNLARCFTQLDRYIFDAKVASK
jgi:hypothetical protein